MSEWIKVTEELPRSSDKEGNISQYVWATNGGEPGGDPVAWMPLPEPPK